jgi:uncharacterized protein YegJ (DUF2314 family)
MSRRKVVLGILVVAVIVALNGYILWERFRSSHEPLPGTQRQQVDLVLKWEAPPVVALNQPLSEVKGAIESYPVNSCSEKFGASYMPLDQLSADQREDLLNAIATLLQCYEKSTATSVISYMQGRNERLDPAILKLVKEERIRDRFITQNELDSISDQDFFAKVWDWNKCRSFWSSIVKKEGYICVWRCQDVGEARNAPLGQEVAETFRNTISYSHLFAPTASLENACKRPERALVADIMVVIQHTPELKSDRGPYYFRFWYSEEDKLWHPFALKRVSTHAGSPGPDTRLMF